MRDDVGKPPTDIAVCSPMPPAKRYVEHSGAAACMESVQATVAMGVAVLKYIAPTH